MGFALGVPVDPVSLGMVLPSRNLVPLMLFGKEAHESISPLPPSPGGPTAVLWYCWREGGFSTCITGGGRDSQCSPPLLRRGHHRPMIVQPHALLRVRCWSSSYRLRCIQTRFCGEGLVQSHAGIPPWKDWIYSASLVCGCLPRSALSRFFPLTLREVGAGSLLSWMHRWGRLFL